MNKNIYYSLCLLMANTLSYAQENISFEENEGYTLGTINEQNDWEVTEGQDGFLTNQIITNEKASQGIYSFKNGHQSEYNSQWMAIFGASKTFETPYNYDQFSISYDVYVTQRNGADFEFNLYGINSANEFVPVVGIGMENRGYIYITTSADYDFGYADAGENWPINEWNNIKIEVNSNEIKYFLNNTLIYTTPNFSQVDIKGLTLLHNNYGGNAFYDNFKINEIELTTSEIIKNDIAIYPNPVNNQLFINTVEHIKTIEIYNILGQLEASSHNLKEINTTTLNSGNYIAKITFKDGKTMTRKFIKK